MHVELAHAAKVTFFDDNNMYVTLDTDEDDEIYQVPNANPVENPMPISNVIISDTNGIDISTIRVEKSSSADSIPETAEALKPPALPIGEKVNLSQKIPIPVDARVPNDAILDWLEKQNPGLADSFAQEFNVSTNRPTGIFRTPKTDRPDHQFNSRGCPTPAPFDPATVHSQAIADITAQYSELNEEGQKDLWLSALASNDSALIHALTNLRVQNTKANSSTQLAKLTKDLLTHSEKHKVNELKYEEQAGKRRLYFHNWLTRLAAVIKMFAQTASVLDIDNDIILFSDPTCIGNRALYMLLCSKVDNFYRNLIQREHNCGDKALRLLKSYCASCTIVDKNHFHREFTNLRLINDETATHFFEAFHHRPYQSHHCR